ncbi:MAG TPA: methyltransferase domain-containing protein [Streptosporangiaceae bacterium]|jgi:SAM-dependent methyltransferase
MKSAVRSTGTKTADIRVNVGCGSSPTAGWVNFDNSLTVRVAHWPAAPALLAALHRLSPQSAALSTLAGRRHIHFANATSRIPCATGSAAAVYSSHMIEHLDRAEAQAFLAEVKRVLSPGGVLRLAAPDLSRLVRDYVASGDADGFVAGLHMGLSRPAGLRDWARWVLVGPRHHLWMYDGSSLAALVGKAGFAEVTVLPPGETGIEDPGQLDLAERAAESIYVEAVRPA